MQLLDVTLHRVSKYNWFVLGAAFLVANAHAQMEFRGELNVLAKTENNEMNVISLSPNNGDGLFPFYGAGPHTRSVVLPGESLSGDKRGSSGFSFSPVANTEVTFDRGDIEVIAEASITLNGTVMNDETSDYGYYPEASADLNTAVEDGIQLYPENAELYGKPATMEWVGDVTVSRMVVVNNSDTTQAQSAIDFSIRTPPGLDQFEGSLSEYRDEDESDIETDGPSNLSIPTTVILDRSPAILGPPPLDEFATEFNTFSIDVETSARVWTSGPSGAVFSAEVTLNVKNIRLQRVTLVEDNSIVPISQLKSISSSGYDWLGNGEPDTMPVDGDLSWKNQADGVFSDSDNWFETDTSSDVDYSPGEGTVVRFNQAATYSVNIGTETISRLSIGEALNQGQEQFLTFTNANLEVDSLSTDPPGVAIENTGFTLDGGSLTSVFAGIAKSSPAIARLTNATWSNSGRLELGGDGAIFINGASTLSSLETRLGVTGLDLEPALVTLEGENAHWQPGTLSIGYFVPGEVIASGSSRLNAGDISLGTLSSATGVLALESGSTLVATSTTIGDLGGGEVTVADLGTDFQPGDLYVGKSAPGELTLNGGATAIAQSLNIGGESEGATGILSLGGAAEDGTPTTLEIAGNETISVIGAGATQQLDPEDGYVATVDVIDGAYLNINGRIDIGANTSGSVLVDGWEIDTEDRSTLSVGSQLTVGAESKGELSIRGGGFVESEILVLDPFSSTESILNVSGIAEDGPPSKLVINEQLKQLGSDFSITDGAEVTIGLAILGDASSSESIPNQEEIIPTFSISGKDPITGSPSSAEIRTLRVGIGSFDADNELFGPAEVTVLNGADLSIGDSLEIGRVGSGYMYVDGASEGERARNSTLNVTNDIFIGVLSQGEQLLEINNGGHVSSRDGYIDYLDSSSASVRVTRVGGGAHSSWLIERKLSIGSSGILSVGVSGVVTIGDAPEIPGKITIGSGGLLTGTGTISTFFQPETSGIGVDNFSGTLAPGESPGTLTIEGDYFQGPDGTLYLEVEGSLPEARDKLVVTGDVSLSGTVVVVFSNEAPSMGETFELIELSGSYSEENLTMRIEGLESGFNSRCEIVEGTWTLVAESDGILLPSNPVEPIEPLRIAEGKDLAWSIDAANEMVYILETSIDLENWTEIQRYVGKGAPYTFEYSDINGQRRFFRILVEDLL